MPESFWSLYYPFWPIRKMLSISFRELRKEEVHEEVHINISIEFDFVD